MERIFTTRFRAELKKLADMRHFVQDAALALKADPAAIPYVVLAVDEVVTNIIVHGYKKEEGYIEIAVGKAEDSLMIRVRDQAPLFDPTSVPSPDLTLPLEERPLGGLGVYLANTFLDDVTYRETAQGGNELTLVKKGIIRNPKESNQ
jgi:serine/threonine-protein kinase RsbW